MHGGFLNETLDKCGIDSNGFILSDEYFTTLAFVDVNPDGEREFLLSAVFPCTVSVSVVLVID